MDALLIFLTSLGTAYLAARFSGRGAFNFADVVLGVFAGVAGLALAQVLGAGAGLGLPLFVACALTLGLESLQHRAPL